jgi:hypothetical protein
MAAVARRPEDLELQVQRVIRSLTSAGGPAVPVDVVERTVRDCFAERHDARIREFVGLLAERAARERLREYAGPAREPSTA